jgi:hypothetical protein
MDPESLVGLLAEPRRLRVFAAVVLGDSTAAEVRSRTGLTLREVAEALRRLADGGLVSAGTPVVAHDEAFKEAARMSAGARPDQVLDPDRARDVVLRAFVVNGRLVSIPAVRAKRRVVLEHIVTSFEPGVRYPEREVDAVLRAWHDDHAALRRYLVDEDLLAREAGVYWRIGGPV